MSFDVEAFYAPHYGPFGIAVDATLTVESAAYPVRVIDKTTGVLNEDQGYQRILPAADMRMPALAALELEAEAVDGAYLDMNGTIWRVESHGFKPSPLGEAQGEIRMYLSKAAPEPEPTPPPAP